jgi:anti-sigma regulatory factor (Ser/Thr protein kinase)
MAEMTRPRGQTAPGAQAAGYGHRRTASIASEISLAAVVTAISHARAYVTSTMTAWGLEGLRDDAILLTSELVTNAVKATAGQEDQAAVRLRLSSDNARVLIEVWDADLRPPAPEDLSEDGTPDPQEESGAGVVPGGDAECALGLVPHP